VRNTVFSDGSRFISQAANGKDDFLAPRGGDELWGEDNYAGAFVIFSERGMDRNLFC